MQVRASVLILAAAVAAGCSGAPSTAPSATSLAVTQVPNASRFASDYINELVNFMQNDSINRDRINWIDFRGQVVERARGAQTIPDLHPAVSLALGQHLTC